MVLCVTMAAAVLSASFVVFLVREAESRSKHVQVSSNIGLRTMLCLWRHVSRSCYDNVQTSERSLWPGQPQHEQRCRVAGIGCSRFQSARGVSCQWPTSERCRDWP